MCLAWSVASSRCLRFHIFCSSALLSDDALVALSNPPRVLPFRSFWSGFLMLRSEILTGATTCFEGVFLVFAFFSLRSCLIL